MGRDRSNSVPQVTQLSGSIKGNQLPKSLLVFGCKAYWRAAGIGDHCTGQEPSGSQALIVSSLQNCITPHLLLLLVSRSVMSAPIMLRTAFATHALFPSKEPSASSFRSCLSPGLFPHDIPLDSHKGQAISRPLQVWTCNRNRSFSFPRGLKLQEESGRHR